MADILVERTQIWLNNTYKERTGYTEIPVNRINRMDNDICIIKSITNRIRNYSDIK